MTTIKINNDLIQDDGTGLYDLGTVVREHQDLQGYAKESTFVLINGYDEWSQISASADPDKFYFVVEQQ